MKKSNKPDIDSAIFTSTMKDREEVPALQKVIPADRKNTRNVKEDEAIIYFRVPDELKIRLDMYIASLGRGSNLQKVGTQIFEDFLNKHAPQNGKS